LDFKKLQFLSRGSYRHAFCFLIQNFAEFGHSVDELWPKNDFQDGGRRHLEF